MVGYIIIAWYVSHLNFLNSKNNNFQTRYLDNVIPSVNGTNKPFYFFLLPSYWEIYILKKDDDDFLSPSSSPVELNEFSPTQPLLDDFEDVLLDDQEMDHFGPQCMDDDATDNNHSNPKIAVQISNLSKNYSKSCFWPSDKNHPNAVSHLSLTIEKGTIFCLLGHNGAGKTTLFNMLTGVLLPTTGSARLFGFDIQKQKESIREIMGVCPQHDLLWEDLTAWQHLEIFAELRGVPRKIRKQCIVDKLEEVELLYVN